MFSNSVSVFVFYGYLKQRITEGSLTVYQVGSQCDTSFISLGSSVYSLVCLLEGRHAFCKAILSAKTLTTSNWFVFDWVGFLMKLANSELES